MDISKFFRPKNGINFAEIVAIGYGSTDPAATSEVASVGTLYLRTNGEMWWKFGANDVDWYKVGVSSWITTGDPTVNHDSADTASVDRKFDSGHFWFNTANQKLWVCVDPTVTTAVWKSISYNGYSDYQSDATQYSETGQSYVKVKELTFAIPTNGDYEIWAAGLVDGQAAALDIRVDGVSIGSGENAHADEQQTISTFSVNTLTSGNHTVEFWLKAIYSDVTAYVDDCRALVKETVAGTSSKPDWSANISAKAFTQPSSNSAEYELATLTNGEEEVAWFDQTTVESLLQQIPALPEDLDPNGKVYIKIIGRPRTYVASRHIQYGFYYSATSDSEDSDVAYTELKLGNQAVENRKHAFEIETTVAALGLSAGDALRFRIDRIAIEAGDTNLEHDWGVIGFRLRIKRT